MNKYSNKNKKISAHYFTITVIIITGFLLLPVYFSLAQETNININTNSNSNTNSNTNTTILPLDNQNVQEIDRQIQEKKLLLEELNKRRESYEESLRIKEQEASSLQNQLSIIDLQVSKTENDIEGINIEVDEINLEIEDLKTKIASKEQELTDIKEKLAQYIRVLYKYEQKSYLEIIVQNNSFSDFFDQIKYSEDLEKNVKSTLDNIKVLKQELEDRKGERETKKKELDDLQNKLKASIDELSNQKVYKTNLLEETKSSERKFENLLDQAKLEQQQADADISNLQQKAKDKLEQGGIGYDNTNATLSWPAISEKGISAYFHDPTYIFRKYFEHPAIDIRISQGTAVQAAASGYVARAKNAGFGYNYVMIIHNDELSTVYGHLSRIDVQEDTYVVRGQTIGLSGGMPGTPGAGRLTTGPHLHFEVRLNGIPVNPLDYLP